MRDTVSVGNSSLTVDSLGARILNLTIHGVKLLSEVTRIDGKKAATHPCTPNFNPEAPMQFGLPQHGTGRISEWQKIPSENSNQLMYQYSIEGGSYPKGVVVTRRFQLSDDSLSVTVTHENTGLEPAPVNYGEHFYWMTPNGWGEASVNGVLVEEQIRTNGIIEIKKENEIEIPGYTTIRLTVDGFPIAMLWAGNKDGVYDTHYGCIEPIEGNPHQGYFGSPSSLIDPGKSRVVSYSVSLK